MGVCGWHAHWIDQSREFYINGYPNIFGPDLLIYSGACDL